MEKTQMEKRKTEEKTQTRHMQAQNKKQMKKRTISWTTQTQILFIIKVEKKKNKQNI